MSPWYLGDITGSSESDSVKGKDNGNGIDSDSEGDGSERDSGSESDSDNEKVDFSYCNAVRGHRVYNYKFCRELYGEQHSLRPNPNSERFQKPVFSLRVDHLRSGSEELKKVIVSSSMGCLIGYREGER